MAGEDLIMHNDSFSYLYQPIVDMQSLQLVRYEALLRVEGVTDIEGFIKTLESNGSIVQLDLNTLRNAIEAIHSSIDEKPIPVAVNISAISLLDQYFQKESIKILSARSVRAVISLEITETYPIKDMPMALKFVKSLQRAGCTVGIDDYGDGHANLDLISNLGLDYLKLSSCITTEVIRNRNAKNLIRNAILESNKGRIEVVAEHIDDFDQYRILRQMGVHLGQGWLFGKAGAKLRSPQDFQTECLKKLLDHYVNRASI